MKDGNEVAVVTGASRGIGKGAAITLGRQGCTVYVTGRSRSSSDHPLSGTIFETAEMVTAAGGNGIPVVCDHSDDDQVRSLFEQVTSEQGRMDILVNSATALYDELNLPENFWEKPLHMGDIIDVGLRSSYVASWYAAHLLLHARQGLIVFISASGAVHYSLGPAYGAQKAGMDKMAFDMDVDFKNANSRVACVSIWPGPVLTERFRMEMTLKPGKFTRLAEMAETQEFTGRLIWALFKDQNLAQKSGKTFIGAELATEYGIKDEGNRQPPSYREMLGVMPFEYYSPIVR